MKEAQFGTDMHGAVVYAITQGLRGKSGNVWRAELKVRSYKFWIHPIRIYYSDSDTKVVHGHISHNERGFDDQIRFKICFREGRPYGDPEISKTKIRDWQREALQVVCKIYDYYKGESLPSDMNAVRLQELIGDKYDGGWESACNDIVTAIVCNTVPRLRFYWSEGRDFNNLPPHYCIINIYEPGDPASGQLMIENVDRLEWRWSPQGKLEGYHCIHFKNPSSPYAWSDNYLCYKGKSNFYCEVGNKIISQQWENLCLSYTDANLGRIWNNTFLCWRAKTQQEFKEEAIVASYPKAGDLTHWTLFNPQFYASLYEDARIACGTNTKALTEHWLNRGVIEGRIGSEVFDPLHYVVNFRELLKNISPSPYVNAMEHWLRYGINNAFSSSLEFDPVWYVARHFDLADILGVEYIKLTAEDLQPFYFNEFADLDPAEPVLVYLKGDIAPQVYVNTKNWISFDKQTGQFIDLRQGATTVTQEQLAAAFEQRGKVFGVNPVSDSGSSAAVPSRGRRVSLGAYGEEVVVGFVSAEMQESINQKLTAIEKKLTQAKGVAKVSLSALMKKPKKFRYVRHFFMVPNSKGGTAIHAAAMRHWINQGLDEGRQASCDFDVKYYLEHNPDLKMAFGTNYRKAFMHWIIYGKQESRWDTIVAK